MQDFQSLFETYRTGGSAQQLQAANALVALADAVPTLLALLSGEQRRSALALLSRCVKKEGNRRLVLAHDHETLASLLRDEDAKTRKNAAVLLGSLDEPAFVPALVSALEAEEQRFVRPSLILALGALGGQAAREALAALPDVEGEDRNARDEREALQKAKSRLMPAVGRIFTALPSPMELWLAPVSGLMDALLEEGQAAGLPLHEWDGYATLTTQDYRSAFSLRSFYEILLPIAQDVPFTPAACAQAMSAHSVYDTLGAMHEGSGPFALRLELRGGVQDRGAFASEFFAALPREQFENAPSSYDIELRAVKKGTTAQLLLRLYTVPDERFAYRSDAVSASMAPAAAAAILRAHRSLMRPDHHVLDPFCGAGTLLAERGKLMGTKSLIGLDISEGAWRIARTNLNQAGLHAKVFHRDCRGFTRTEGFDEILCNLPFGHRVGSHQQNRQLYDEVLAQWQSALNPGGFVLAITNDKQLFLSCARRHRWRIVKATAFAYGGLSPSAYVLQRD